MSEKRTEINEIGEFGLIERIRKTGQTNRKSTVKSIGDDAAVISSTPNMVTLLSTDLLLEGIHFDLSYMPIQHLGFKSISVNVSDMAAMNALPTHAVVSLALSNRFSVEAVEALYSGINAASKAFNVDIVGGDTTSSKSGLMISVSILGESPKAHVTYRDGAKKHDILCVTGDLGGAFMGLQVLEREKAEYQANPNLQPDLEKYSYVVGRQLRPKARLDIVHELRSLNIIPTAMIDISDGLASDVMHLCKQSGLGVSIYEEKLPIDEQTYSTSAEFNIDPNTSAFNGGEDYELLFTITPKDQGKLKNHDDIHMIGYMHELEKGNVVVTRNGNAIELKAQGWRHF